jgi:FkbM family methyltransferase
MTFVSYAQNHEDVVLYRAFRDVKQGFYIDVGAQDPVIDSVTKAFYDRGWHGINIEPNEEYFEKLQRERPHDITLSTAVGQEVGVTDFYAVAHTGLSTTSAVYAQRHSEAGYQVERREIPCTTLDHICADCAVGTVHFLKIDVEGAERSVLEGFSFSAVRPWIVVVEATEPNSDREVFTDWEHLLVRRDYRFIYFDGLNRFYAAEEHADLATHFSRPPNWFDQYITYQLWRTRTELDEIQAAERNALINSLNQMCNELKNLRAEGQRLQEAKVASEQALEREAAEREQALQREAAEREQALQRGAAEREQALQREAAEREEQLLSLEEAMSQRERVLARLQEAMAQRDRQLVSLQTNLGAAQLRLKSIRSSISWKLTSPLRETRRAAVRLAALLRRPKPPSEQAIAALAKSDLVVADEIAAGLSEPARLLYRHLRDATHLQRQMGESRLSEEERI